MSELFTNENVICIPFFLALTLEQNLYVTAIMYTLDTVIMQADSSHTLVHTSVNTFLQCFKVEDSHSQSSISIQQKNLIYLFFLGSSQLEMDGCRGHVFLSLRKI